MANRQNSSVLVNKTISKLPGYRSEGVPRDSELFDLFHPTTQKSPDYADDFTEDAGQDIRQRIKRQVKSSPLTKGTTKKAKGTALIFIAWILLVLNFLAVMGSLAYGPNSAPSMRAVENTNGFSFRIGMLACGAFVLACTTYLRKRAGGNVVVPFLIIMALSVTLASLVKESGDVKAVITNIRGLGQTLLCFFHSTTPVTREPMCQIVNGILYSEDKPSAILGNQIVHEGDILRHFNVVRIYRDKVEFERNGERWTQPIENRLLTY